MAKPTELKLAADIIRRVLDAAERGDNELLNHIKQATRKRINDSKNVSPKQEVLEYGRYGAKFTEKDIILEIDAFSDIDKLSEHLRTKYPTRADIDAVSRAIRVPVAKNTDYDGVVGRIVDATLGYKMRSKAVRGPIADRKIKEG